MLVLLSNQVRAAEQKAVDLGMNWLRLMENAGSAAARKIRENYKLNNKKVVIVCGKGNNGGDGYVIARKLMDNNAHVRVIAVGKPSTDSAIEMASKSYSLGIKPIDFESYDELCSQYICDADIIVDAIFGTGFKGVASGIYSSIISTINTSSAIKIAIDIPSGMCSDISAVNSPVVKADMTITFASYKPCHLLNPSSEYCGNVIVASIGMPAESFNGIEPYMQVVTDEQVASLLPVRHAEFHKGLCGTAGMFVGCKGYSGAAVLSALATVKSGVGIANLIIPENIYPIIASQLPEAICTLIDGENREAANKEDTLNVIDTLNNCTCGLLGCGIGNSIYSKNIITEVLKNCIVPLVIDADGINVLSDCINLIKQYKNSVILTPHPKEASRLLNCTVSDIQNDRIGSAKKICSLTNSVTVLKGAKTIIADQSGKTYVVTDGNSGMATAGTGDVLAGMITAFLCQGLSAEKAAICAVKLHALAGDIAVKKTSILSLTPTDMINTLPELYCRMYSLK